jgi:hypothetical protein
VRLPWYLRAVERTSQASLVASHGTSAGVSICRRPTQTAARSYALNKLRRRSS